MTLEEAIKLLRGIQNKKVDYAEMVCAPAFACNQYNILEVMEDE